MAKELRTGMKVKIKDTIHTLHRYGVSDPMLKMVGQVYKIDGSLHGNGFRISGWSWDGEDLMPADNMTKFNREDKTLWKSLFE